MLLNKFVEICVSTTADAIKINNTNAENTVCLTISIFIFSFLLSLYIDLYAFNALTPNDIIPGINIMFCIIIAIDVNAIPFATPNTTVILDIVYPKQNPLNAIIPNTIGIPIIVLPINHIISVNIILSFILFCNNVMLLA